MLHLQGLGEPAIARCLSIQRIEPKFESWQSVEAAFLSEEGQTWRGPGGGARFKEFVKSHGGRCHTPGVRAAVRDLASSGAPVEDLHAQGLLLKSLDNAQLTRSGFGDHAFQADRVGSLKPLKIKGFQVSNQPHGGVGWQLGLQLAIAPHAIWGAAASPRETQLSLEVAHACCSGFTWIVIQGSQRFSAQTQLS